MLVLHQRPSILSVDLSLLGWPPKGGSGQLVDLVCLVASGRRKGGEGAGKPSFTARIDRIYAPSKLARYLLRDGG